MRTSLLVLVPALLLVVPAAAQPPPEDLPSGVLDITQTAVAPGTDFVVTVHVDADAGFDRATLTLCRFRALDEADPELCFMNLKATFAGTAFRADTKDAAHPPWEADWVLGYKVTLKGEAEASVPADGGYYRFPVVQETAGAEPPEERTPEERAPLGPAAWYLLLAIALVQYVRAKRK